MKYSIGKSTASQPSARVEEVTRSFQSPKLIIYFSPVENFKEYTEMIHAKFPDSVCIGSTSKTMLTKENADANALLAVGIESGITCSAGVIENVDKYPIKSVETVKKCVRELGTTSNTVCFELTTALLCAEESVLSTLNSVLLERNIPVFGGTAGDDASAVVTMVALNGVIREKSTVFVLIHNEGGAIHFFRENIYKPSTGHKFIATKVDMTKRKVMTFDNMPAITAYARNMGLSEAEAAKMFDTHPLGRMVGDEIFITANCSLEPDRGMIYHARIYENSQVMVLEPDDYRSVFKGTMEKIHSVCPRPSFAIVCNCLARTLLFEGEGFIQDFAHTLGGTLGNYIGFSGYGEQLGQHHFNQTMAVCVFE